MTIGVAGVQVRVYDPPLCCASGVRGASENPAFSEAAAAFAWLADRGLASPGSTWRKSPRPSPPTRRWLDCWPRTLAEWTLAETTPVAEAARLVDDLGRAGITPYGRVVNNILDPSVTADPVLAARAGLQGPQLERVRLLSEQVWTLSWQPEPPVGTERLSALAGAGRTP